MKNKFALLKMVRKNVDVVNKEEQDICPRHPKYRAIYKPLVDCPKCCEIYEKKGKNAAERSSNEYDKSLARNG